MTEDNDTTQTSEDTQTAVDDSRFEVKWRKKSEPSPNPQGPGAVDSAQTPGAEVADLQRELEEERKRVTELRDRWQRAAADLANLRRRTEQERSELEKFASMLLVQELLPVLDNFERAIATIPGNLQMLTWIQGVMLVERQLRAILERQGLAAIDTKGQPFSAHYHEAIAERETAEAASGTILQEYQRGYTMHGMVIRPSLVEVARARSSEERPPEAQQAEGPPPQAVEATDQTTGEEIAEEAESENVGP